MPTNPVLLLVIAVPLVFQLPAFRAYSAYGAGVIGCRGVSCVYAPLLAPGRTWMLIQRPLPVKADGPKSTVMVNKPLVTGTSSTCTPASGLTIVPPTALSN